MNIIGKAKDICELIESARSRYSSDDVSAFNEIIITLNNKHQSNIRGGGGHLHKNIYPKVREFASNPKTENVGVSLTSVYLDGLSLIVNEKRYVEHYGRYNPDKIYHTRKGIIDNPKKDAKTKDQFNTLATQSVSTKPEVRIGFTILPDGVLQYVNRSSYSRHLKPRFISTAEWRTDLDKLINNEVDFLLHNFPSVLAYYLNGGMDKLVFIPLFTFKGYVGLARTKALHSYYSKQKPKPVNFEELNTELKRIFISGEEIIVPVGTDVEWVFMDYCNTKLKIDYNELRQSGKIKEIELNPGRKLFLKKQQYALYLTNSFQAIDLQKSEKQFELILQGDKFTRHQNINGFICKESFFFDESNKKLIGELIDTWYNDINEFLEEKDGIISNDGKGDIHYHTNQLPVLLNKKLGTNVTLLELMKSYQRTNNFFKTPSEAFDFFFENVLDKSESKRNNFGIANIQLNKHDSEIDEDIIKYIIEQNQKVRTHLGY